jgi:hypothetical protein
MKTEASMYTSASFFGLATASVKDDNLLTWIKDAISSDCDPHMQQQGMLSEGLAGEWIFKVRNREARRNLVSLSEHLWDEAFLILEAMGRIEFAAGLMPWHGNLLLDDSSSRAIALRLRIARRVLQIDPEVFYRSCGLESKAAAALEQGEAPSLERLFAALDAVSENYDIPSDWLLSGEACEIEA